MPKSHRLRSKAVVCHSVVEQGHSRGGYRVSISRVRREIDEAFFLKERREWDTIIDYIDAVIVAAWQSRQDVFSDGKPDAKVRTRSTRFVFLTVIESKSFRWLPNSRSRFWPAFRMSTRSQP